MKRTGFIDKPDVYYLENLSQWLDRLDKSSPERVLFRLEILGA